MSGFRLIINNKKDNIKVTHQYERCYYISSNNFQLSLDLHPNAINRIQEHQHFAFCLFGNIVFKKTFESRWVEFTRLERFPENKEIIDLFRHLTGIYALTIINKLTGELRITADPLSFYPIYYYKSDHQLVLASSVLHFLEFKDQLHWDESLIYNYLQNGNFVLNRTWYKEILRMKSGMLMKLDCNNLAFSFQAFWSWREIQIDVSNNLDLLMESFHEIFSKSIGDLNFENQEKIGISLSGGADSRYMSAICSKYWDAETYTFSAGHSKDLILAQEVSSNLQLKHTYYELTYDHWLKDRLPAFWNCGGAVNVGQFHEGTIYNLIKEEYNICFHGVFAQVFNEKLPGGKLTHDEARRVLACSPEEYDIEDPYYEYPSLSPYFFEHNVKNKSAQVIYNLSHYVTIVPPFYDLNLFYFLYSLPLHYTVHGKFYLEVMHRYLPKALSKIPWQKTGISLQYPHWNYVAIKYKWPVIKERVYGMFGKSDHFYNYRNIEKELDFWIKEFALEKYFDDINFDKSRQHKLNILSYYIWQEMHKKQTYAIL
ncbi:MAG: asparagine synthase-related protein [Bacteroidota bacterium]|nr:asparagine synthase-related protein [Bacteroidota bacterium]